MRRILVSSIAATLAMSFMPPSAHAAVKAGAACSKIDQISIAQGKKYTCVKSGKKLVWNKGVLFKKPATPAPSPTLPNIVFPLHNVGTGICDVQGGSAQEVRASSSYVRTTKTYSNLWQKYGILKPDSWEAIDQKAISSFRSYVSQKKQSEAEVHISMEPGITDETTMSTLYRNLVAVGELLGTRVEYPTFRKSVFIIAFKNWDWLKDEYVSLGCDPVTAVQRATPVSTITGWTDPLTLTVILNLGHPNSKSGGKFQSNLGILGGHEFFHLIQFQNTSGLKNVTEVAQPAWLVEGGASLVGALVSDHLKIAPFEVRYTSKGISGSSEGKTLNLEVSNNTQFVYSLGLLGSEFLVSIVGFDKFVKIWKESGNGKVFSDAFQDATGIELIDFYKMFYEIRPILGLKQE
jgi:hypothetical protein